VAGAGSVAELNLLKTRSPTEIHASRSGVHSRFLAVCFPIEFLEGKSQSQGSNPSSGCLGTVVGLGGLRAQSVPRRRVCVAELRCCGL
jgi:hypothetical protein